MKESILNGKRILAVDDEPDVLEVLEEEIMGTCPNCRVDKATAYERAVEMLKSNTYDLVILDIMGVRGFDLLEVAVSRNFRVAMLTAYTLNPEALMRSFKMMARAYLPKEKLGEIMPFLEDALRYEYKPGWQRLLEKLGRYFSGHWRVNWAETEMEIWKELLGEKERISDGERTIFP